LVFAFILAARVNTAVSNEGGNMAFRFDPNNSDQGRFRYANKPKRREQHLYEQDYYTLKADPADCGEPREAVNVWYPSRTQYEDYGGG
jgi:hypothetical protein